MSADTIFAVATGSGRAAICVVRVSGPLAQDITRTIAGRLPPPRVATLARLRDPITGETLDHALVLFFEATRSELGEDGVEFHLHGGQAVVAGVLGVLARIQGARPAEAGEFARRAFLNGKMDLAQVEGLADLIDAETAWQRRQAQRQLSGAMRDATAPWRAALVGAAAQVETAIDFADDVELGATVYAEVASRVAPVRAGLRRELATAGAAERVREGVHVVIAGPPNAGKSTLLNALARREAAIVSAIAGTTRDPIEVHLDLAGCPITLVDTAGLRESADAIERIGVTRARERADAADLVLWLGDGEALPAFAAPVWAIEAKADLRAPETVPPAPSTNEVPLAISARTGHNLDRLVERLGVFARDIARTGAAGLLARARHKQAFEAALAALDHAVADADLPLELLAEDLRTARFALERLIGSVDVEDILGDIFSRFCIGK
jgi:tRNA modification GTPase